MPPNKGCQDCKLGVRLSPQTSEKLIEALIPVVARKVFLSEPNLLQAFTQLMWRPLRIVTDHAAQ